jgi:hypothetical protein
MLSLLLLPIECEGGTVKRSMERGRLVDATNLRAEQGRGTKQAGVLRAPRTYSAAGATHPGQRD